MQKFSKQQVKSVGLKKEKKLKSNLQFSLYQNQRKIGWTKLNFFLFRGAYPKKTTTNKNIKFTHSQIKKKQQQKIYILRYKS